MSVFCVKCGTKNDDDSLFCRNCGEKLKKDPENGSNAKSRPKYDVFISHSSKNKNIADAICANFEQHKIKCWYAPRDIRAGESWPAAIKHGIEEAEILVLVFSENANESRQVINEVSIAYNCGKTIIPFKIADTPMNDDFDYFLNRVHWLDAMTQPMEESIDAMRKYAENILGYTYSTYEEEASASTEPKAAVSEPEAVKNEAEITVSEPEAVSDSTAEPVHVSEPEVASEPVTPSEPEVASEPVTPSEPEVAPEPVTPSEPEVTSESATSTEPEVASEPVTPSEPEVASEPAASTEPVVASESAISSEPVVASESVTSIEPVVASESATSSEPSDKAEDYGKCVECAEKLTKKGDNLCPDCRRKKNLEKMPITRSVKESDSAEVEAPVEKKNSSNKPVIIAVVAVVAVVILIASFPTKSRKAASLYKEGKYEQALELYKELGDQNGIYNATFSLGKEAKNQLDLDKALEYFEQINEYPDAQEEILSTKHVKGILLKDSGDYDSAIEILSDLGDYSLAKLDLVEAKFLKAEKLMNDQDYDGAITLFSELADGEFAETKFGESDYSADVLLSYCKFKKAEGMAETNPDAAIVLLSGLGTYQPHDGLLNAKQLIYKCNFEKANKYLDGGDYNSAIQLLSELDSQRSNTVDNLQAKIPAMIKTSKYKYVENNFNTTDSYTRKYLDELSAIGYGDSVTKWASLYGWVSAALIEDYGNPNSDLVYSVKTVGYRTRDDGDAHVVVYTSGDLKNPKGLRCRIDGNDPEGTILVSKVYKDGEQVGDPLEQEIKIHNDNSWEAAIKWTAPEYWTGTHTVKWEFFDKEGHYMAEVSAKVINDDN